MSGRPGLLRRFLRIAWFGAYLLVFLEVSARALLLVGPIFQAVVGRDDTSSERLTWVRRHRHEEAFAAREYSFDVYDPLRGWAVKPNVVDLPVFNKRTLNTNSRGLRGRTEYPYDRDPTRRRIVTLGDSYTFGDEVSDNETYSYDLSRLMPGTDVLNLGVHGYGHDQVLLYLKTEGLKYRPDVVLVGFVWFDMNRNLSAFSNFAKPRFELRRGILTLTNVPVPSPQSVLDQEVYRLKLFDLGSMLLDRVRSRLGINRERAETITRAIFDDLVVAVRQSGAVPVFVYLPVLDEVLNHDPALTSNEEFLVDYCTGRKVPCLLLRRRFLEEEDKGSIFNTRGHWLGNGHAVAAQRIREYLVTTGLLEPGRSARRTTPEALLALR